MKKQIYLIIATLIFLIPVVCGADVKITGFVNDYAGVISSESKVQIEPILQSLYDQGIAQISIVTIDSLNGESIESYSLRIAQGHLGENGKNNGLLILIAVQEKKYRFEVGRGIEDKLTDSITGRIGRTYFVPNFKSGNYGAGVYQAVVSIDEILNNKENVITKKESGLSSDKIKLIIWTVIIVLLILRAIISAKKNKSKGKDDDHFFQAGMIGGILMGRGGSGGSGGFGGFGGGGFGGGGSSGGW